MNTIITNNCQSCNINIKTNIHSDQTNHYYFFCSECIKNLNVCAKSNCNKLFLLNDNDLKNLKYIYLLNNNSKFYLYDDIKKIVVTKYGSLDNLKILIKQNKNKKKLQQQKKQNDKLKREKDLRELFIFHKLEYKNFGLCYEYVNYGKPSINVVLETELAKLEEKTKRQNDLAKILYNLNIPLDNNNKLCYEYINGITNKSIDDVIKSIRFEYNLDNVNFQIDNYDIYKINNDICV